MQLIKLPNRKRYASTSDAEVLIKFNTIHSNNLNVQW